MNITLIRSRLNKFLINPYIVPFLTLITLMSLALLHRVFIEQDGIIAVNAAREMLNGQGYHGWIALHKPPFLSALLALSLPFSTGFVWGKTIAVLSGFVSMILCWHLAITLTGSRKIAVVSQLFYLANPLFLSNGVIVETHMLDATFVLGGLYLLVQCIENPTTKRVILMGLALGLAAITRWTSLEFPVLTGLVLIVTMRSLKGLKLFGIFVVTVGLVTAPWFYYNWKTNGSPLFSWTYVSINLGVVMHQDPIKESPKVHWYYPALFNSPKEVFMHNPKGYVKNVVLNLRESLVLLVKGTGYGLALCLIPGLFAMALLPKYLSRKWLLLYGIMAINTFAVSQALVFPDVFLIWIVPNTIACVAFLNQFLTRFSERYALKRTLLLTTVMGLALGVNAAYAGIMTHAFIRAETTMPHLSQHDAITRFLKTYDPAIKQKVIMSVHCLRAFDLDAKYLCVPSYYTGSLDDMVRYRTLPEKIKFSAPKRPFNLQPLTADYLVVDDAMLQILPHLSYLKTPKSLQIPADFEAVFVTPETVVYKIHHKKDTPDQ